MTKWGDRPHWEFDTVFLGRDAHGDWLGIAAGTTLARPGATYVAPTRQVVLVPPPGPDAERGWLAAFHDIGGPVHAYVDIATPPVWNAATVRTVDLDLDVLLGVDRPGCRGRAWVDDEDEFADHRIRYGYPDEIAEAALASCARVHALMAGGHAPYDGSATAWLARLGDLLAR